MMLRYQAGDCYGKLGFVCCASDFAIVKSLAGVEDSL
jgi:hypothetical protein